MLVGESRSAERNENAAKVAFGLMVEKAYHRSYSWRKRLRKVSASDLPRTIPATDLVSAR